jgi:hypothetical protein
MLAPLSLLSWYKLSFQIVDLKMSSFPNFSLKSANRIFIRSLGNDWKLAPFPQKLSFETSPPLPSCGACSFKTMILHQRPLKTVYDTQSLTKSTLLTADTILCDIRKNLFPADIPFAYRRKQKPPALTVPPLSHLTSCTPTNSIYYLANFLAAAVTEPDL